MRKASTLCTSSPTLIFCFSGTGISLWFYLTFAQTEHSYNNSLNVLLCWFMITSLWTLGRLGGLVTLLMGRVPCFLACLVISACVPVIVSFASSSAGCFVFLQIFQSFALGRSDITWEQCGPLELRFYDLLSGSRAGLKFCCWLLTRVWLSATPWTAARQASLSFTASWSPSIESALPCRSVWAHCPLSQRRACPGAWLTGACSAMVNRGIAPFQTALHTPLPRRARASLPPAAPGDHLSWSVFSGQLSPLWHCITAASHLTSPDSPRGPTRTTASLFSRRNLETPSGPWAAAGVGPTPPAPSLRDLCPTLPGGQCLQSQPFIHCLVVHCFFGCSSGTVNSPSQPEGKVFPNGNALNLVFHDGRVSVSNGQNSLNSVDPAGPHLTVVVQSLRCVWLCDPTNCSSPGFPVLHQLPELAQTHCCSNAF